jgi:hypothetical protein
MSEKQGVHNRIFTRYVAVPFRLILSNLGVLVPLFFVLLANWYFNKSTDGSIVFSSDWLYRNAPTILHKILISKLALLIVATGFVIQSVLTLVVAKEMMLIYSRTRIGLLDTIAKIKLNEVAWFFSGELLIYFVFGVIAILVYLPTYLLWEHLEINLYFVVFLAFAVLYPAFYMMVAMLSTFAVLPLYSNSKIKKMIYLLSGKRLWNLYLFYLLRLGLEMIFAIGLPIAFMAYFHNIILATVSAILGLVLPFALLRGAAYALKLQLLINDEEISVIFNRYFVSQAHGK